MAILDLHLTKFFQSLELAAPVQRLATLGWPDVVVRPETVQNILGADHQQLPPDPLTAKMRKRHRVAPDRDIYDLVTYLGSVRGIEVQVLDYTAHRGNEIAIDLNEPLAPDLRQAFDAVLDASVMEHCFNVAQAFRNMLELVRLRGVISTVAPIYWYNHGFYNINPVMYQHGFTDNGFKILYQGVMDQAGREITDFGPHARPQRMFNLVVAQRTEIRPWIWPQQRHKGQASTNLI